MATSGQEAGLASTYPVASASSSITYAYNPTTETYDRQTRVLGPIIGERAETIGLGQMDMGLSYSYVDLSAIDGVDLGHLENLPVVDGQVIAFAIPGGVVLANGRFSNFLPVHVMPDLAVRAHIVSPSVTYGVTPDWDVNLTVPLLVTALDVSADVTVPDPRLPQFALPPGYRSSTRSRHPGEGHRVCG